MKMLRSDFIVIVIFFCLFAFFAHRKFQSTKDMNSLISALEGNNIVIAKDYLDKYPEGKLVNEAAGVIIKSICDKNFVTFSDHNYLYDIKNCNRINTTIKSQCDSLDDIFWSILEDHVIQGYKITREDQLTLKGLNDGHMYLVTYEADHSEWDSDEKAWTSAIKLNDYVRYDTLYPHGLHQEELKILKIKALLAKQTNIYLQNNTMPILPHDYSKHINNSELITFCETPFSERNGYSKVIVRVTNTNLKVFIIGEKDAALIESCPSLSGNAVLKNGVYKITFINERVCHSQSLKLNGNEYSCCVCVMSELNKKMEDIILHSTRTIAL